MLDGTKLIFTSTTGRSGTKYLSELINKNARNATAEHDPYPRGYGEPILWYDRGEDRKLLRFSVRKMKRLERGIRYEHILSRPLPSRLIGREKSNSKIYIASQHLLRARFPSVEIKEIYLESTHAFVKSFGEAMYSLRPDMYLIHLTRDPLEVAKSFMNRGSIPGPNNPFLLDPLLKRNILRIDGGMTDFQKCLWYWFETELRHQEFIERNLVEKVYHIDIKEMRDKEKVKELFRFFGIEHGDIELRAERNRNKVPTEITERDLQEARELLDRIPEWVFERIGDRYGIRERLHG